MPNLSDVAALASIAFTALGLAVSWGVMSARLDAMKDNYNELEDRHEETRRTYVTLDHFRAMLTPIQDTQKEMQRDIKKILSAVVSRSGSPFRRNDDND